MKNKTDSAYSEWSEALPVWKAQREFRKKLGLSDNHRNGGIQPWKEYPEAQPMGCLIEMAFSFQVKDIPKGPVWLAIETPHIFGIKVNNKVVSNKSEGWWVDRAFEKVDITSALKKGKNSVSLVTDYQAEYEIEDMYLIGDFAVDQKTVALVKEPEELCYGDWVPQGYPFYSGAITYFKDVVVKKKKNDRIFLNFNSPTVTIIAVSVNGQRAGLMAWEPYTIDITRSVRNGKNKIAIEVVSSRRNSLGPLHNTTKPAWVSSREFREPTTWTDDYVFVPYGLTGEAEVVTKR